MRSSYKRLGDYIALVDERNVDLKVTTLLGLSISKQFIPSVANTIGTDMKNYKIIRKNQFACSVMQVRRDGKMPVALLRDFEEAIISQAYPVFEVIDTKLLLPEYLMMWFTRSEFDRQATFHAVGGVRGSLEWEDFMDFELPVPSLETQQEIVEEYHTITKRIELNEQLNQKLEETAQALYKHWFVDFEFPIDLCHTERSRSVSEDGINNKIKYSKGYKSSGGAMVYNEELDGEIPEGWDLKNLSEIAKIKGGKRMPSGESLISEPTGHPYIKVADLGIEKFALLNEKYEYVPLVAQSKIARYIVSKGDLILSIVGTIGIAKIIGDSLDKANLTENCVKITVKQRVDSSFVYHYLKSKEGQEEIAMRNVGAVQAKLPIYNIETFPILCPTDDVFKSFKTIILSLDERMIKTQKENVQLFKIRELLLSKMATVVIEEEIVTN